MGRVAGMLCGLAWRIAATGGMFFFWSAARGLVSIGIMLCREAANPTPGDVDVSADRMLCRIFGCALEGDSTSPRVPVRIVDPICGSSRDVLVGPPRMVLFMCV